MEAVEGKENDRNMRKKNKKGWCFLVLANKFLEANF